MFLNTTYRDENNLNSNDTSLYTSPGTTCMNEFIERMLYFSNQTNKFHAVMTSNIYIEPWKL